MSSFLDKLGGVDKLKSKENLSSKQILLSNKKSKGIVLPKSVQQNIEEQKQIIIEEPQQIIDNTDISKYKELQEFKDIQEKIQNKKSKNKGSEKVTVNRIKKITKKKKKIEEEPIVTNSEPEKIQLQQKIVEEISEDIEVISEALHLQNNLDTEETLDVIEEISEDIEEAIEVIPDFNEEISLDDIEVIEVKSKTGYTKTTVGFKKDTPNEMSVIATYARKNSNNIIKPRTMNIMNINNVNKTQLRNSELKLGKQSYTFKPDHTKLKVPKFKRFIISIFEDFKSTMEVVVYIQDSRSKFVFKTKINGKTDLEFLGKLIADFYFEGFDVVKRKLQFKNTSNPLLNLIPSLVKTKVFKVKPLKVYEDKEYIESLLVKLDTGVNTWLNLIIQESNYMSGLYDLYLTADFDETWKVKINKEIFNDTNPVLIENLHNQNILNKIEKLCNLPKENFKKIGLDFNDNNTNMLLWLNKLNYRATKKVLVELLNHIDDEDNPNKNNIEIINVYGQLETLKLLDLNKSDDYKPELIVFKNNQYEYVLLSYFAMEIKGGDKRSGRQYINRDEYYQKYNVKDRRNYQQRRRTVLKKQDGVERNYNSRPYMFQCEYKLNGKEHKIVAKTFEEINNKLKFI